MGLIGVLVVSASIFAQTTEQTTPTPGLGTVQVEVHDATDLPIRDAAVTLTGPGGSTTRTSTNDRGEVVFENIGPGVYSGHVESAGFNSFLIEPFSIRAGAQVTRRVTLQVAGFVERLEVRPGVDDRQLMTVFTRQLTADEVAALPEDPEELALILRQMAGDGADIRVDGFSGGRLPLGTRIRDVRIRDDLGAASGDGGPRIEIRTSPGGNRWRNAVGMSVRDEGLGARNAFYGERPVGRTQEYSWTLDAPLVRTRTSLSASIDGSKSIENQMTRVATPGGTYSNVIEQPANQIGLWTRVEHEISPAQTIRVDFTRNVNDAHHQGIGEFDLPERAFSSEGSEGELRIGHHATLRRGYVNDFRFRMQWDSAATTPVSEGGTIRVLDAFTSGGAQQQGGRRSRTLQFENELAFSARRHQITLGASVEGAHYHGDEETNAAGTYTFASLDSFGAGQPTTFVQRLGDPSYAFSMSHYGWYIQDDFPARRNLTINLGLRHDFQTHMREWANFSPRIGTSWTPSSKTRTILRASAGVVHSPLGAGMYRQTLLLDGRHQWDLVISSPGFPDPFSTGVVVALPPPSIIRVDPELRMPFNRRYSVGFDQPIGKFFRFRETLSRQAGHDLFRSRDANAPVNGVRPDASFRSITQLESTARSRNDSLQTELSINYPPQRLWASVRYVLGKALNETDGPFSLPPDSFDLAGEWGPARGDAKHRVNASLNTDLPGGFRVNAEFQSQSAGAYNVTLGSDANGDGIANERPAGVTRNGARGTGTKNLDFTLTWRLNLRQHQSPVLADGADGQTSRDDDPFRFELFAHATNVLNFVNPTGFSGVLTSPFFGMPTSAAAARRLTLGTRVLF